MKTFPLLAVLCLATPAALAAGMATPTPQELPQTLTRSGHQFVAHCSDDDFARARFPQKLASKCTSLLLSWQAEASARGNRMGPPAGGIERFGAPRGIPFVPPPPPHPRAG